jgi:hypothetical protein
MANQRKESAVAFLEAAVAYFAKLGVRIERVMMGSWPMPSRYRRPPLLAGLASTGAMMMRLSPGAYRNPCQLLIALCGAVDTYDN